MQTPDFQKNGQFDPELYHRLLAANHFTPALFESMQAMELLSHKARMIVRDSVALTPAEIAEAQALMLRQPDPTQKAPRQMNGLQDFFFQKQQRASGAYQQSLKAKVPIPIIESISTAPVCLSCAAHLPLVNQHCIAIAVEAIALLHGLIIGASSRSNPGKGRDQHHKVVRGKWKFVSMASTTSEPITWRDVVRRFASIGIDEACFIRGRFQGSNHRRPNGHHSSAPPIWFA